MHLDKRRDFAEVIGDPVIRFHQDERDFDHEGNEVVKTIDGKIKQKPDPKLKAVE